MVGTLPWLEGRGALHRLIAQNYILNLRQIFLSKSKVFKGRSTAQATPKDRQIWLKEGGLSKAE